MAIGTIAVPTLPNTGSKTRWDRDESNARYRTRDVQLTSGANYTTGGETVTAKAVGLNYIEQVFNLGIVVSADGTTSRSVGARFQADGSVKLSVQTTASAEASASSDQSTYIARLTFVGR